MTEKLRRIKLERRTFEPKDWRDKLEPFKIFPYNLTDENVKKGLEAEEFAMKWLQKEFGSEHVIDMRYSDKLTEFNNGILEALEGRGFSEHRSFWQYRNREVKLHPERKYELSSIMDLLGELKSKTKDDDSLKIINELILRFEGLDAYEFIELVGKLRGTKLDWIAVKNGKAIFFDSKYWDDMNKDLKINKRELSFYMEFSKAGIPFFLLIYNPESKRLFQVDIRELPSDKSYISKDLIEKGFLECIS